jgi:ankyrin repeat protein
MRDGGFVQWGVVAVLMAALSGAPSASTAASARLQGRAAPVGGASAVASAAMAGDLAEVRRLLRDGGDVNAAMGDGTNALHHAAMRGDAAMVGVLLLAGANLRATTRLGGYTGLHLASQRGHDAVIDLLVKAGAHPNQPTATGATPLMLAAASGHVPAVKQLLAHKADVDAKELANDQTALMFAAAFDRAEVVKLLVEVGANVSLTSKVVDVASLTSPEEALQEEIRLATQRASAQSSGRPAPAPANPANEIPGVTRSYRYNELIDKQGGFGALHYAARQGSLASVKALLDGRADVNHRAAGDGTTPLLIAVINGHYDLAMHLLDQGADPNIASEAGAAPLYAAVNIEWAPKSFYPQPRAQLQQRTTYLDLMKTLLDKGADPNARLKKKIWYTQYNFDLLRTDEGGATPFWRAAYAADIDAMSCCSRAVPIRSSPR